MTYSLLLVDQNQESITFSNKQCSFLSEDGYKILYINIYAIGQHSNKCSDQNYLKSELLIN